MDSLTLLHAFSADRWSTDDLPNSDINSGPVNGLERELLLEVLIDRWIGRMWDLESMGDPVLQKLMKMLGKVVVLADLIQLKYTENLKKI